MGDTELKEAVLKVIRENPEWVLDALGPKFEGAVREVVMKMVQGKSLLELLATGPNPQTP